MTWPDLLRRDEPDWIRPKPDRAGYVRDAKFAAALVALGLVLTLCARAAGVASQDNQADLWVQVLVVLATGLPLALRRRYPELIACWEALALFFWQNLGLADALSINVYLFVALYTLGAWGRHRVRADIVRLLIVIGMFVWLAVSFGFSLASDEPMPGAPADGALSPWIASAVYGFVVNAIYLGGAWYFGNRSWVSARDAHDLQERTIALQAERETNARTAVIGERVRIARELHDVVAHSVSLMGVQAAAARRSIEKSPATAVEFLDAAEHTARSTVTELAGLLGVLRSEGSLESAGGVVDVNHLDDIVESARDAGLDANATVVGEPFPISAPASVSLYRVAQEAVTNTIRHARATKVDIRLRYADSEVEIEVVDDGLPPHASTKGSGLGQLGMSERMNLHGGQLIVGPRSTTRGYRVLARVPAQRTPADAASTERTADA